MVSSFASLSVEKLGELNLLVERYNQRHSFDGNVLIKQKGEVLFEKSVGYAQAEWRVPNTSDSKFMIASLSKSFTAAQILIMQNKNLLSLEDLVSDHIKLPKESVVNRELWLKLKIKHLLNHTGGLKRDFFNAASGHRSTYQHLNKTIFHALEDNKIFISTPGEKFHYSNFGYVLLAGVIESAGTRFYEDELKNNILRDLKMFNTAEYHRLKYIEYMTDGYLLGERGLVSKRCCDDATSLRGAANLYSTASDLIIWLEALRDSKKTFGFDLLEEMLQDTVHSDLEGSYYGYGLVEEGVGSTHRIYHVGHEWGYQSSMSLYPKENLQIVVLANRHEFLGNAYGNRADELSVEINKILIAQ